MSEELLYCEDCDETVSARATDTPDEYQCTVCGSVIFTNDDYSEEDENFPEYEEYEDKEDEE